MDWTDVKLSISTGDPSQDISLPSLETWRLNYANDDGQGEGYLGEEYRLQQTPTDQYGRPIPPPMAYDPSMSRTKNVEVPQLNTEFEIPQRYTIPAKGIPYRVLVKTNELVAQYSYFVVPKVNTKVFLLAEITGWEDLNLVSGKASIYYAQSYLGDALINVNSMRDTLRLSLGTDNKVIATRQKMNDKRALSLQYEEDLSYKIEVKNTRKVPINLEIWDQVPVSQEKDIAVSVKEISKAQYEEVSGKLVWELNLKPSETRTFVIDVEIKYPRNKRVKVRNTRSFQTPRYF